MLCSSIIFAQVWHWQAGSEAVNMGGFQFASDAISNGVCTDNEGNYYVTGYSELGKFDGQDLVAAFVVKVNSEGQVTSYGPPNNSGWLSGVSGSTGTMGMDIICDDDYVYQVGFFTSGVFYNSNWIPANGASDIFITRYHKDSGVQDWFQVFSGPGQDEAVALALHGNNLYITGMAGTSIDFGNTTVNNDFSSSYDNNPFVAILNKQSGTIIDAIKAESQVNGAGGMANDIVVDANGNALIAGEQSSDLVFSSNTASLSGVKNGFLAKYNDVTDVWDWVETLSSPDASHTSMVNAIDLDGQGDIYIAGNYTQRLEFAANGNYIPNSGNTDLFFAKYNSSGVYQWCREKGGMLNEYANDICILPNGYAYLTGYTKGKMPTPQGTMFSFAGENYVYSSVDQFLLFRYDVSSVNGNEVSVMRDNAQHGKAICPLIDASGCFVASNLIFPTDKYFEISKLTERRDNILIQDADKDSTGTEPYIGGNWWGHTKYFYNTVGSWGGTNPQVGDNPEVGKDNYLNVIYKNIGETNVEEGVFKFYYHESSIGDKWEAGKGFYWNTPNGDIGDWKWLGEATLTPVRKGETKHIFLKWEPQNAGEYCFLVRFVSEKDPMTFPEIESIGMNIQYNNNIAEKNMVVLDKKKKIYLPILPTRDQYMKIRFASIYADFREYGETFVSLGEILFEKWMGAGERFEGMERVEENLFLIQDFRKAAFDGILMKEGDEPYEIMLDFQIREDMEVYAKDMVIFDVEQHISTDQETYTLNDGQSYQVITVKEEKKTGIIDSYGTESLDEKFRVYPNPSEGIVNYSFVIAEINNIDIKVYNLLGELVGEYVNAPVSGIIDMTMLSEGTYILEASDSKGQTYYQKLIKE